MSTTPQVQQAMEGLFAEVEQKIPDVEVASPYAAEGARQISRNGKIAYAQINFADRSGEEFTADGKEIKQLAADVDVPGLRLEFGGDIFADAEIGGASEAIGLLAAMIILLLAFGSVLAMGLPIGTALFGIGTGAAIVLSVRTVLDMPDFTTAAVAMVGLGVGIDYALFIVTRYRENLAAGADPERSVVHALDTAGRAVLFAGTTVVISVLGLLLMKTSVIRGVAIGISIGVLTTMLASVTLLPALLGFVGRNIDKFGLPHRKRPEGEIKESGWTRWSHVIQRHPWPAAILGLVFLLVLAIPLLSMRLGFTDAGNRPESDTTRQAYDLVADGFGAGFNGPLLARRGDAERPGRRRRAERAQRQAQRRPRASRSPRRRRPTPRARSRCCRCSPPPTRRPRRRPSLVDHLRDDVIPSVVGDQVDVKVGGLTAAADDFAAYTAERLPIFMGAVLILSFLLLMLVFRSLLVPLKAVIMNLLSIGAAYGVVVAVFQWGWGASLIGVGREAPVEAWAPVFIFAIVFGSVDGLRGVPALAHPRGVRPHRRQRDRGRRRPRAHRAASSPPPR